MGNRVGAALSGTGGITLPGTRLRISRIPESSSATTIVRSAVLPSLPAVLIGLPDCQVCRIAKSPGLSGLPEQRSSQFWLIWLRCKNLGTGCFWRCLTVNCLQLAQVRRSVFLRRPKNRMSRKMCLGVACKAVFTKPSVPRFLHRARAAFATGQPLPLGSLRHRHKLYHNCQFCQPCRLCHFFFPANLVIRS